MEVDPKGCSLDDLIKADKRKGGNRNNKKPNNQNRGIRGKQPAGARPRFNDPKRFLRNDRLRAKRTGNMIQKQRETSNQQIPRQRVAQNNRFKVSSG
jgi:hypothetical protein